MVVSRTGDHLVPFQLVDVLQLVDPSRSKPPPTAKHRREDTQETPLRKSKLKPRCRSRLVQTGPLPPSATS